MPVVADSSFELTELPWFLVLFMSSFWLAAAIGMGFWVAHLVQQYRMRRRKRACLCLHCGYDLRASPERCPECGTPVPTKPAA